MHRREWFQQVAAGLITGGIAKSGSLQCADRAPASLRITSIQVTPIALPDPPILAASGCHGPYFLRNIVEIDTDSGITGIGETHGGESVTRALIRSQDIVRGQPVFSYRRFAPRIQALSPAAYAGIELACLDALGKAMGRRLCELLGGPVREEVEFAAYLFYRYAADHPKLLADKRIVDSRGQGEKALDQWGEVRTPETMAAMADQWKKLWGFRVFKLKAGVLPPDVELETMQALASRLGSKCLLRIDPNARWTTATAIRIGQRLKGLPMEYYEDPVRGQEAMAQVRQATGLVMSTNMCVTRFEHFPEAIRLRPVDVVLSDHHYWGGIPACQELGRLCATLGWGLSQHSNNHAGITMAAMIHLAASTSQLTIASDTHYPWLPPGSDIIEGSKLPIEGGMMKIPAGPGLGVTLNRDRLAQAHETYQRCGMRGRDDAYTMRLVEPGWQRTPY